MASSVLFGCDPTNTSVLASFASAAWVSSSSTALLEVLNTGMNSPNRVFGWWELSKGYSYSTEQSSQAGSAEEPSQSSSEEQLPQAVGGGAAQEVGTEQISQSSDARQLSEKPSFQRPTQIWYPDRTSDVDSLLGEVQLLGDTNRFKEYEWRADAISFRRFPFYLSYSNSDSMKYFGSADTDA